MSGVVDWIDEQVKDPEFRAGVEKRLEGMRRDQGTGGARGRPPFSGGKAV